MDKKEYIVFQEFISECAFKEFPTISTIIIAKGEAISPEEAEDKFYIQVKEHLPRKL